MELVFTGTDFFFLQGVGGGACCQTVSNLSQMLGLVGWREPEAKKAWGWVKPLQLRGLQAIKNAALG